jgi:hypothetical protein
MFEHPLLEFRPRLAQVASQRCTKAETKAVELQLLVIV